MKKYVAVFLSAIMFILPLAACGDDNPDNSGEPNASASGYVYVPEYITMPDEVTDMNNMTYYDGYLYFVSNHEIEGEEYLIRTDAGGAVPYTHTEVREMDGGAVMMTESTEDKPVPAEEDDDNPLTLPMPEDGVIPDGYMVTRDYTYENTLNKVKTDGTGLESLSGYTLPDEARESENASHHIQRIACDTQGNIWTLESIYNYSEESGYENYYVRKLDATGAELMSIDASSLKTGNEEYFYISGMAADAEGNVYLSSDQTLYAFDSAGTKTFQLDVDNYINTMLTIKDGRAAISTFGNSRGYEVWTIDPQAKTWGDKFTTKTYAYNYLTGNGDYDFYYYDDSNLYGYKVADKAEDKLVNWLDSDINGGNMSGVVVDEDGAILCMTYNYGYDDNDEYYHRYEMAKLVATPASEIPVKTVLNMAVYYLDYNLRAEILDFNKKSATHRISVTDYSDYNDYSSEDSANWNAGLTKLSTEIVSGNIPDIVATGNLPMQQYINKDIIEDLTPYLEADSELSMDMLVESVVRASQVNGKLYQVASGFYVQTAVGNTSIVGEKEGWTIDEAMAVLNAAPQGASLFDYYYTKSDMLRMSCMFDINNYIDWSTGQCNFDSEDFIKVLEFANTFPAEYEYDENRDPDYLLAQQGLLIAQPVGIYDFKDSYQQYKAIFGGELTFKGFPASDSNGHGLYLTDGLAMTTSCVDKDVAWEFMRRVLTEDYQSNGRGWGLPTNKNVLDEKIEKDMKKETYIDPETGEEVELSMGSMSYQDGFTIEYHAATQEDVDHIMGLINSIDRVVSYDEEVMALIIEEAEPFFAGQKTAQDVASIIQSRMSIYVSEQM